MASSYTPTTVNQGFGAETEINQNFSDIKTALDEMLSRIDSTNNAMSQDFDMASNRILNLPAPSLATDPVRLTDLNSLSVTEVIQDLGSSATINVDSTSVTVGDITLTQDTTVNFTGTPPDGTVILLRIRQNSTGGWTITWGSEVRFSDDLNTPVLSTAGDKLDYLLFRYNEADTTFDFLALNRGFI